MIDINSVRVSVFSKGADFLIFIFSSRLLQLKAMGTSQKLMFLKSDKQISCSTMELR